MKKRSTFQARRRTAARKIAGCKLMQPPELCQKCSWATGEGGRRLCPFPTCVVRTKGWPLRP